MIVGTIIRCDVIDCKFVKDGECSKQIIDMDFYQQDNLHEYAICKDYEQEEKQCGSI